MINIAVFLFWLWAFGLTLYNAYLGKPVEYDGLIFYGLATLVYSGLDILKMRKE